MRTQKVMAGKKKQPAAGWGDTKAAFHKTRHGRAMAPVDSRRLEFRPVRSLDRHHCLPQARLKTISQQEVDRLWRHMGEIRTIAASAAAAAWDKMRPGVVCRIKGTTSWADNFAS